MQLKENIRVEFIHKILERRNEIGLNTRGILSINENVKLHIREELDILEDICVYQAQLRSSINRRVYG